jgi:NADH-quinone oxidoreductase subunit A|tara:strand:- start:11020 stop:11385 length:366 start_codon:yes stop_codon:yes gene_type:complete
VISDYFPILVIFLLVSAFVGVSLIITHLLGPRIKDKIKLSPYESGVDPLEDTRIRFTIKFFIIAMLFIIFDIEVVFLFPWAVVFKDFLSTGNLIFWEMAVFLGILLFGFIFVWKKGALDWE